MTDIPYGYCGCGCGRKTDLSKENRPKLGYVKGKPLLFLKHHSAKKRGPKPLPIAPRFWSKVDIRGEDECWDWKGQILHDKYVAYGKFYLNGKKVLAHRVAWELTYGEIPDGLCVLHKCDRGICCNPKHHFLGTRVDNAADRDAKGRGNGGGKPGMGCGHAKLTDSDVKEIRLLASQGMSQSTIARKFDITQGNVSCIVLRKSWKNVP